MLEDTDGDGTFDKRTVFADKLTFPSGALWHRGALYVCSPPGPLEVRRHRRRRRRRQARRRSSPASAPPATPPTCTAPSSAPRAGSTSATAATATTLTLGDGTQWKGKAACVYRCRTDGSGLEVVFGGGFDNPVEVAFTPEGEPLVNVNILHAQPPPRRRDRLRHRGRQLPLRRRLARAAPHRRLPAQPSATSAGSRRAGSCATAARALGAKYVGRYFSTEFNPHRVRVARRRARRRRLPRHARGLPHLRQPRLPPDRRARRRRRQPAGRSTPAAGSASAARQSQIAKPDVKGGDLPRPHGRSRSADADDPRGLKLKWERLDEDELAERLGDARRRRARPRRCRRRVQWRPPWRPVLQENVDRDGPRPTGRGSDREPRSRRFAPTVPAADSDDASRGSADGPAAARDARPILLR